MAKIKMLSTRWGNDGDGANLYHKDHIYDVRDNLAASFNSMGYSEAADVIYYQIRWLKTGCITRQPITLAISHYINRGLVQLVEV
jgi:hypothetical protein